MGYEMDMSEEKKPVRKTLIPEGWRPIIIKSAKESVSKSGNKMIVANVMDIRLEYEEDVYFITEPKKRWFIKSLLNSLNLYAGKDGIYKWDIPDILNKKLVGKYEHEDNEYINRDGVTVRGKQHKIVDFRPYSENPDGVISPQEIQWKDDEK